ncbi:MAG: glycoside hydrolase family 3 protein, partial [Gemmatimonadota bacterium]
MRPFFFALAVLMAAPTTVSSAAAVAASSSIPAPMGPVPAAVPAAPSAATPAASDDWVDRTLARLSLRDKVAQMVMPWLPGGSPRPGSAEWRRAHRLVAELGVGGVIVGRGDAIETAAWLNELQRAAEVPLLVSADLEWGAGTRLEGATVLPVNMAIAATGDAGYAFEAGRLTASEARAAGIHMAFAPVADVNVNPANPVINTRSYGADPVSVARYVGEFVRGARTGGMLTAVKHFPGHGDTELDSHLTLPVLAVSPTRLQQVELVPFRAAIEMGADAVMTAHLSVPSLEPRRRRGLPATLSPSIVSELLRDELGFDGLVVTDALTMDGVRRGRRAAQIVVGAVRAGADILLMPSDAEDAIDAVLAAVRRGILSESRIDESVRRVLRAKARAGLDRGDATVDIWNLLSVLDDADARAFAQELTERSLTLVGGGGSGSLPVTLHRGPVLRVLSIAYADSRRAEINEAFDRELERVGGFVRAIRLWERSDDDDLER